MEKKKYKIECESCHGTGLYSGIAEGKECAVICYHCDGQGWVWHTVPAEFIARKERKGIKRIFKDSCGYTHGAHDIITKEGKPIEFSKASCTYKEFLEGKRPKPVKELYCPYLWSNQNMQHKEHKAHKMYKQCCDRGIGSRISNCPKYKNALTECWPKYEELSKDWDD